MTLDDKILPYLNHNAASTLGVANFDDAIVKKLPGGDYNLNYHVSHGENDFLVRVNIEPQSGLDTQIEYEYSTLEFLAPFGVTPKPLYLDNSRKYLPYGLLIEEFVHGQHLQFNVSGLKRVAVAMAALHTAPIKSAPLRIKKNPLASQFDAITVSLANYKQRSNASIELISTANTILNIIHKNLTNLADTYKPRSIVHTDPNPANVIDDGNKVFFIDWEQGQIDDPSYDVGALFTPQLNKWAAPRELTYEEKCAFLDTYIGCTGDTTIEERSKLRTTLHAVNCAIWAAHRIADVDEAKIDENLGNQNYKRYQAMADTIELERVAAL